MNQFSLSVEGKSFLPVSSYAPGSQAEPLHGICHKAEGYHLINLCLHALANRPFIFKPGIIEDLVTKEQQPIWLIQKNPRIWTVQSLLGLPASDATTVGSEQALKLDLGITSYLVVDAVGSSVASLAGKLVVPYPKHMRNGFGYAMRDMNKWEQSLSFFRNRSLIPTFPENALLYEVLMSSFDIFQASNWSSIFINALKWAQQQRDASMSR